MKVITKVWIARVFPVAMRAVLKIVERYVMSSSTRDWFQISSRETENVFPIFQSMDYRKTTGLVRDKKRF